MFVPFVFNMAFHVVILMTRRHLLPSALRFSSSILMLCFLPSQTFFGWSIKLFLTQVKIFIYLMASTLTQQVSTIYIIVTGAPFFGHCAYFKISIHIPCIFLNFHNFHASIFPQLVTFSTVMGIYFMWLIHSLLMCQVLFLGFVAGSLILLFLCEDSSSTLSIRPLFSLLWFYPLSQGRFVYSDYRKLVSIVIVCTRPLLLIKLGFMAVINFYV